MKRKTCAPGTTSRSGVVPNHGYATAEFAMVLPVLTFFVMSFIWIAGLCVTQLQIQNTAFVLARDLSRGQSVSEVSKLARMNNFEIEQVSDGHYISVMVTARRSILPVLKTREVKLAAMSVGRLELDYLHHSN